MNRCRECLIPDTRPDTEFVDGVCSACINYKARACVDWGEREEQLRELLHQHHDPSRQWDVIVPSSGGKDSHYQVIALQAMGARVLCVTATTCHLTPIGKQNIENLARYAPTIEVTPNMTVRRKLNRIGLEKVGDISWPEHAGIFTVPFRMAKQLGIPLLFYGENPQREYGGPLGTEEARQMNARWVSEFGGFLGLRASDIPAIDPSITPNDMRHYQMPDPTYHLPDLAPTVEAYFLGQFLPWDSQRNGEIARDAGMMWDRPGPANWWPYENLDNAQTGLHDHMMYRKYGYGRLCAQLSVDIRAGRISREEAYPIVQARDGAFPTIYANVSMAEGLRRIGMSVDELKAILERFTNWDLFAREEDGRPILKEFA
jgi:N-acetyl sugar amidotransferase